MANEDWMSGFTNRDDLTLANVTFPASHDAGLSEAPGCFKGYHFTASRPDTICQYFDIAGQLAAGSRAFDLRIEKTNGELRTLHGEGAVGRIGGGWGQNAVDIFKQVNTFLKSHQGEIVILRISHTDESDKVHEAILSNIDESNLLACGPRNLAVLPLSQLRGKAIAIFDSKALARTQPFKGLHRFYKYGDGDTAQEGLPICGKYAGQFAGLREMANLAVKMGNEHGEHRRGLMGRHDHIYMVYWQLAWDVKNKTTKLNTSRDTDLSKLNDDAGTHYNLDYLLNMHRGKPVYHVTYNPTIGFKDKAYSKITDSNYRLHQPNWINLDFICEDVCNKVIAFNNELLPAVPQTVG